MTTERTFRADMEREAQRIKRAQFVDAMRAQVVAIDDPRVQYALACAARQLGLFSARTSVTDITNSLFGIHLNKSNVVEFDADHAKDKPK